MQKCIKFDKITKVLAKYSLKDKNFDEEGVSNWRNFIEGY